MIDYYKVLADDRQPCNGGSGQWPLVGLWTPRIDDIEPCKQGYHLCRRDDLIHWIGRNIYTAEARGLIVEDANKIVCQQARLIKRLDTWNDRTARLFACDCAERVLHLYENVFPDDNSPRNAIEVSRRFANGKATKQELISAASAAWAAWDARAASAAWAAGAASAARAAWAARDDEKAWQTERLFEYLEGKVQ